MWVRGTPCCSGGQHSDLLALRVIVLLARAALQRGVGARLLTPTSALKLAPPCSSWLVGACRPSICGAGGSTVCRVAAGADVDWMAFDGRTALISAVEKASDACVTDIVGVLLEPPATTFLSKCGRSACHRAFDGFVFSRVGSERRLLIAHAWPDADERREALCRQSYRTWSRHSRVCGAPLKLGPRVPRRCRGS